jgi:hypothetical protein
VGHKLLLTAVAAAAAAAAAATAATARDGRKNVLPYFTFYDFLSVKNMI